MRIRIADGGLTEGSMKSSRTGASVMGALMTEVSMGSETQQELWGEAQ